MFFTKKEYDKVGRLFVLLCCFVFTFVCCSCWGNGHFDGSGHIVVLQNLSKYKNPITCKIEGMKMHIFGDDVDVPILPFYFQCFSRVFLNAPNKYYRVYHFILENETVFVTYKFPLTMGVGAVDENSDFVIIESEESLTFYYNRKPVDGFTVEQKPFSKKIKFEYSDKLFDLKKEEGACYYMR